MTDRTTTERLLDGAGSSSSASAQSYSISYDSHYQSNDYHDHHPRPRNDGSGDGGGDSGGEGGAIPRVSALSSGGGVSPDKVPFLLPHATATGPVAVRPAGDQRQRHLRNRHVRAGKGGGLIVCAAGKPASLQLPLRMGGHEEAGGSSTDSELGAAEKKGGGSPRSRRRAHTALSYFEPECIICLEPFEKSNPRIKSKCRCGTYSMANSMHLSCMFAWIEQQEGKQICPVCRDHIDFDGSD
jgi:hypothetical protein